MGRLYSEAMVLTNAFHAVRGITTRLDEDDILLFERLVCEEMPVATTETGDDEGSAVRFERAEARPVEYPCVCGSFLAPDGIGDEELRSTNLCLAGDEVARLAFARARKRFAEHMRETAGSRVPLGATRIDA